MITPRHSWTIASDVKEIAAIVEAVSELCASAGFSSRLCRLNVPLALTEAMANAIMRGNSNDPTRAVHVRAVLESDVLLLEVMDQGPGFDLDLVKYSPDDPDWLEREDGRGVFLMRQLMDHVESCRTDGTYGHTVRLRLRRA
jgi:serine/threonine-protein kinase RsbW